MLALRTNTYLSTLYPTFYNSSAGNLAAIEEMLTWGADVNVFDHSGATPLAAALAADQKDAAALVKAAGGKGRVKVAPVVPTLPDQVRRLSACNGNDCTQRQASSFGGRHPLHFALLLRLWTLMRTCSKRLYVQADLCFTRD